MGLDDLAIDIPAGWDALSPDEKPLAAGRSAAIIRRSPSNYEIFGDYNFDGDVSLGAFDTFNIVPYPGEIASFTATSLTNQGFLTLSCPFTADVINARNFTVAGLGVRITGDVTNINQALFSTTGKSAQIIGDFLNQDSARLNVASNLSVNELRNLSDDPIGVIVSGSLGVVTFVNDDGSTAWLLPDSTIRLGVLWNLGTFTVETTKPFAGIGGDPITIHNSGIISGDLHLTAGADYLFNYQGTGAVLYGMLYGGAGNDQFFDAAADASFYGDAGDDTLSPDAGDAYFNGGDGVDTMLYDITDDIHLDLRLTTAQVTRFDSTETLISVERVIGGSGDDVLIGDSANNELVGRDGDDYIEGGAGDDILEGGAGTDTLSYAHASAGVVVDFQLDTPQDTVGAGVDWLFIGAFENLEGSAFNDRLTGTSGANHLIGGNGDDQLEGVDGDDILNGGAGNDTASYANSLGTNASLATNLATRGGGVETLISIENLSGSAFADVLTGNTGINVLSGGDGSDILNGGAGADVLRGGFGNDTMYVDNAGDSATDELDGGVDTVVAARSWAVASNIERVILTGTGDFNVAGNGLANNLKGNSGDNWLNGSFGKDTLTGGGGRDSFIFNRTLGANNIDIITDYDVVRDTIRIDNAVFAGIGAAGGLAAGKFFIGAAAHDADDRILYDSATGRLSFDIDGAGGASAVQFATLSKGLALTNLDFIVI